MRQKSLLPLSPSPSSQYLKYFGVDLCLLWRGSCFPTLPHAPPPNVIIAPQFQPQVCIKGSVEFHCPAEDLRGILLQAGTQFQEVQLLLYPCMQGMTCTIPIPRGHGSIPAHLLWRGQCYCGHQGQDFQKWLLILDAQVQTPQRILIVQECCASPLWKSSSFKVSQFERPEIANHFWKARSRITIFVLSLSRKVGWRREGGILQPFSPMYILIAVAIV